MLREDNNRAVKPTIDKSLTKSLFPSSTIEIWLKVSLRNIVRCQFIHCYNSPPNMDQRVHQWISSPRTIWTGPLSNSVDRQPYEQGAHWLSYRQKDLNSPCQLSDKAFKSVCLIHTKNVRIKLSQQINLLSQ